jgi:hypothetical protein
MAYKVDFAEVIRQRLLELEALATQAGQQAAFLAALRQLAQELQARPLTFGELLYHLPGTGRPVFLGAVSPLVVRYAVAEDQQLAWIVKVDLLPGP